MKVYSNVCPKNNFAIERHGENAEIIFYENISKQGGNDFSYDEYRLTVTYRDTLEESVTEYFDQWLLLAKLKTEGGGGNI